MAFFDEKKGAVSVEVVEAQLDADEPRTNLTVHPHSFFEGGHARVRDEEGNFILRVDGASVQEKRGRSPSKFALITRQTDIHLALRRSFHSRVFDMSTPYGASELTVYPPWCNGRLRFDEHFPRRYFGAKADTTLDVRPMSGDSRRTRILRAGEEIGIITQPRFGLGAWEVSVLPGMDEPMVSCTFGGPLHQRLTDFPDRCPYYYSHATERDSC